jgi:hypothetical protein
LGQPISRSDYALRETGRHDEVALLANPAHPALINANMDTCGPDRSPCFSHNSIVKTILLQRLITRYAASV